MCFLIIPFFCGVFFVFFCFFCLCMVSADFCVFCDCFTFFCVLLWIVCVCFC